MRILSIFLTSLLAATALAAEEASDKQRLGNRIWNKLSNIFAGKPSALPPQVIALDIATGNWKAQSVRAFISSGIAGAMEELCVNGKYTSSDQIAETAGMKPGPTYRLLRFLSSFGVCIEGNNKDFTLGAVGEVLTPNHPQSVAAHVLWEASLTPALVWDQLEHFLQTGEMATKKVLQVDNMWSYMHDHPDVYALFLRAMTGNTNEQAFIVSNPELTPTLDLSMFDTICDLGAAQGKLALALNDRFPNAKYIVADMSDVVGRLDGNTMPPNFSIQATNFLDEVPPKADAYLMKHIIHDWSDKLTAVILGNVKKANPEATLFIFEFGPMPGPNVPHLAKGFDLHMGVLLDALERTQEEYDALWEHNGYKRVTTHYLSSGDPLYIQELNPKTATAQEL